MPFDLIDTHCHLNVAEYFPEPDSAIAEAREAKVGRIILVGLDVPTSRRAIELAELHTGIYAIVGHHPNYAAQYDSGELEELRLMLEHPRVVALGEIGLDFHWDHATREQQEKALFEQLDLAESAAKPVVFHCREAYPELLTILEARPQRPYLFHCFSGKYADARRAIDLGCMFGVDGPITYKKSEELRAVFKTLPPDRIVIETDSPYLTPVPHRGKPNKPAYLPLVNEGLALLLGMSVEDCADLTTANAERFFRLPAN